jgi:hypothetical protein
MKNFWNKSALFLMLFLLIGIVQNADAQDAKMTLKIKIDQIVSKDFPDIIAYALVENAKGEAVANLSPGLFKFRIDSLEETGKAVITPFSMKDIPIDYSIIFSNNGIMEGEPLDFQKNAILQFVESMKDADKLSLYAIGEEAAVIFEEQKKDAIDPSIINSVVVSSAQPRIYDSVINVMRKVQRRQAERRIVFIISDGRDQNSRFTKEQLTAVLKEVEVPIYALGFRVLNTQSLSNLNEMADLTGGTYLFTSRVSEIPKGLSNLSGKTIQPYIIKLRVRSLKADDLPHVFEVSIDERDSTGKGQKVFVAVKIPLPRWVRWAVLIAIAVVLAVLIFLSILRRIIKRKRMGITSRRCPDCHNRMKDTWDTCPFCRYMPNIKKKKKKRKKDD